MQKCELEYKTPYELLVATVLSAQSTDVRVNIVTKELFKNFNTPEKILKLGEEKLMEYIKSIGFYNVKSKNIIALSHLLIQNYDSQVPDEMDELLKLPGVGRKTANVVLSNCFGVPAIAVDTHVFRVSTRLGFSDKKDPLQVEQDLMKKISKKYWTDAHHAFIFMEEGFVRQGIQCVSYVQYKAIVNFIKEKGRKEGFSEKSWHYISNKLYTDCYICCYVP
jgi:DNA-(apurinic or apyrimidinic site) lyase (EC 4.2.99.18)/endonuclease III (EC 3.2.2.-)